MVKKGQITIFIIIGLVLLFLIGTYLYMTRTEVTKRIEATRPSIGQAPQQIQPLRDSVETCILQLGTDGLKRIGDGGGYLEWEKLAVNPAEPTDADAVQFSPGAGPNTAYWWHMSSKNDCRENCIFESERPGLYRTDGGINIETQLDNYVTSNLKSCLAGFTDYEQVTGCTVQERGEPQVTANVAESDVFFVGKYPLRVACEGQTYDTEEYYVSIDLNLKEIYNFATELANFQKDQRMLEQVTKNVISVYSGVNSQSLPPFRVMDVGPPKPSVFWIKRDVEQNLKNLLATYVPLIQMNGVQNYNYIASPPDVRDPEHFELFYNRNFFIPLNTTHPTLEARFTYLDWWEPYFELNCNGQLCQADSGSNFDILQFSVHRYQFAYDLSYPVLAEIRNPRALNEQGYSFKFFIEQNMRNSDAFITDLPDLLPAGEQVPSIFCAPEQHTSGKVNITAKDGYTLQGLGGGHISFICGQNNCNMGTTEEGILAKQFPRCLGGILKLTKQGYETKTVLLNTDRETEQEVELMIEPIRTLNATIKNYQLTKAGKRDPWEFLDPIPSRPSPYQSTVIVLTRNGTTFDEPFVTVAQIDGVEKSTINLVPGMYTVKITTLYKGNLTIPEDRRCIKIKKLFKTDKKCYDVPQDPIKFNETSPFPYGGAEYNWYVTPAMLRNAHQIEFRQFVAAIDKVPENQRIVEDLEVTTKTNLYSKSSFERIRPVIT